MRKLILLSAAAAMAAVAPSLADAQGRGKGHGTNHSRAHPSHVAGHPNGCPPGLANRNPPCVPPGQARRMFHEGQRLPVNYSYYTGYDAIPITVRNRYGIPTGYRYIYRDNVVYVVDPTTRLVRDIIDILN